MFEGWPGPVPLADEHTSIPRETCGLTTESACVADLKDQNLRASVYRTQPLYDTLTIPGLVLVAGPFLAQFRAGAFMVRFFNSIPDKIELREPRVELTPDRLARGFSFAPSRALMPPWTPTLRMSSARPSPMPRLPAGIMLGRLSRPSGLYELCVNELVADAIGKIGCVVM